MYEESKLEFLPKYFKDLHLEVAAITGSPRIACTKPGQTSTDKYKNIPKEEWESAILNWAGFLEKGYVQMTTDGKFVVAGRLAVENKSQVIPSMIKALRKLADELEEGSTF